MIASTRICFRVAGRPVVMFARYLLAGLAIAAMASLVGAAPARAQQDPLAAEFAKRDSELQTIKASVAKAQELRNSLESDIGVLRSHFGLSDESSAQARLINERLRLGEAVMRRHVALQRFAVHVEHVQNANDAAYELQLLRNALWDDRLKKAIAGLRSVAAKAGDATPRLADLSASYEVAVSRLSETVAATLREIAIMRSQGRLKSALYGGSEDRRYQELVSEWGQGVANAAQLEPSSPWEIFRPVAQPGRKRPDFALIWDESERDWHKVAAAVPLEAIFRDAYIGLGKRPSAGKLKYIADNLGQVKVQQNAATAIARYLTEAGAGKAAPQDQAFGDLADGEKIIATLRDTEVFRARFVFDNAFRGLILEGLDRLRQDLAQQGPLTAGSLKRLDTLLAAHAIKLDSQWVKGALPKTGTVRVVAWFSDRPDTRFVSTWMFDRERVTIDANNGDVRNNGSGQGIRRGNVVRSERSTPGRNCVTSDERVFEEGGRVSFLSVYVCTREDGTLQTNLVSGAGTWEMVSPANDQPASSRL